MFLISYGVSQSKTSFTFSSSILISSGLITTPKNPTSFIFHFYFSDFTYRSFFTNLFTTSSTISSGPSSVSIPTITLLIKLTTFQVLISHIGIKAWIMREPSGLGTKFCLVITVETAQLKNPLNIIIDVSIIVTSLVSKSQIFH